MELFGHPFSCFHQKVLVALYENDTPFDFRMVGPDAPENQSRFEALWPIAQMPLLVDEGRVIVESAVIIEYCDVHHPGFQRMVPADPAEAIAVRQMDKIIDDYVAVPMQRIVADFIRPPDERDARTIIEAKQRLDTIYDWLESRLTGRTWAVGAQFGLADCAAAPALFYSDWVHPIGERRAALAAYRARLLARPSVTRCVEEARPYRHFFPPGAPDRD